METQLITTNELAAEESPQSHAHLYGLLTMLVLVKYVAQAVAPRWKLGQEIKATAVTSLSCGTKISMVRNLMFTTMLRTPLEASLLKK